MRKPLRLRILLSTFALASLAEVQAQQNVGINVTGAAPNASALLDLDVSGIAGQKRGLLIPRMLRADRLAIPAPPTGLWVYQTDDVTVPAFDPAQEHGFWYFDGTQWVRWASGIGSWLTTGNAGTNPNATLPNYLGTRGGTQNFNMRTITPLTTDPQVTVLGTTGHVGINSPAPPERLDVNGAMRIFPVGAGAGSATNLDGTIRYETAAAPNRWHSGKVPAASLSATTVAGSANVTVPAGYTTAVLAAGMLVSGPGIPPGATVASITNATTFVLSAAATAAGASVTLNFSNATGWQRLENAEELVTNVSFTRDSLGCSIAGEMVTSPANGAPGTDNGVTVVAGNVKTPYPTNIGVNNRIARTQYLFRADELSQMGLCPGNITEVAFYALQNDVNLPGPPVQQASINYEIRVGPATGAGLTGPTGNFTLAQWDNGVQASAVRSTGTTVVLGGWQPYPLNPPYNWNGTDNIIIDVYWLRGATNGNSPAVQLVTGLPYNATRQGLPNGAVGVGLPNVAAQVPAFDDNSAAVGLNATSVPNPPQLVMTNDATRPVTRFKGQVKTPFPANAFGDMVRYSGGLMIGDAAWASAAGNYKGPGTIHAKTGVYDGNSLLNDHVFDRYFDGRVRPEDREAAEDYTYVALPDLKDHLERERHLPNMPSRSEWNEGGVPSLGELHNGLWQQVETQALYIAELERDLSALETLAFGEEAADKETLAAMEADIRRSPRLTEQQKLHLIQALRSKAGNQ